jgi:hypothetical protein
MSETLERSAEIAKLARLIGVERKELDYLEQVPAAALRTFRDQATDRLFAGDAGRLRRVAAASKLLPVPLTVKIAQIAFGPLLCAATAGLLDPPHAVKVASKCPTGFLADITVNLDPRRAPDVIAAVPTRLVVAVAKELLTRDEHVTMGRFVSYLSKDTLRAAVAEMPDDADILRVAFVMEGKERLDELIDVARERLPGLVRTAYEQQLWAEALDLIEQLSLDNRARLADIAAAEDDDMLDALIRAAHELDAWDIVLPVTAAMSPESLRRFAAVPALARPEVLRSVIDTATQHDLWQTALLPMVDTMSQDDLDKFTALLDADTDEPVWDALVEVRAHMPKRVRTAVSARAKTLGRKDVTSALKA